MARSPDEGYNEDEPVLLYLAALEARRTPNENEPHPDEAGERLARAPMVDPGPDGDGLAQQLGEGTPGSEANLARLEPAFVEHARSYAERHGMTYQAWQEAGVPDEVLARAGIGPDRDVSPP